ncbi:hypothetical protein SAMD00019534_070380 [Acytostelium subglobosum LB1]|uniref:hypothetical protein n=1 Tax=Acytostelium subglobosum LB1 TaxID=1410327 RepID=UPI000644D3A1|nr:hypothetical protein SAMD00019534_070380 [Acytostelium subglobosum LB1]GAM23863.1 hypothetical protein SAMD00019534_070380 [Acytostelium subglobosum LB1]|eukprot:XP_012752899.1 hypothetical protein SAMD00019534_070380 [Acytostelium subglobosum LB1]
MDRNGGGYVNNPSLLKVQQQQLRGKISEELSDDDGLDIDDTASTASTLSQNDHDHQQQLLQTQVLDDDDANSDEIAPTQPVADDFELDRSDTMLISNEDMGDDITKDNNNNNVNVSGNGNHYHNLVRLKSTLRDHEIPFSELVVEREIGKGFFGKVYKATWRGKSVALKKITISRFRDRSDSDLFTKELSIISRLCHPTCVMFIGACSTDPSNRYIVMEYMAGGSLRKFLDERAYLITPNLQLAIARDIADGMCYLHTNFDEPIIHRDLTSSNVLLNGDYSVAKINDFGLSKEMKSGHNEMTAAMGSMAWMAPESFRGEKYTEKVDIYSFAILLWELITLKDPYCGMEPLRMAFLANMYDYRPPLNQIPSQWQQLISRCWHPKPEQRPSFKEILVLIDQIEQNSAASSIFMMPPTLNIKPSLSSASPSSSQQSNSSSFTPPANVTPNSSFIQQPQQMAQPPLNRSVTMSDYSGSGGGSGSGNKGYYASQGMEYETVPTTLTKQQSSNLSLINNEPVRLFGQPTHSSAGIISCLDSTTDQQHQYLMVGYRDGAFIRSYDLGTEVCNNTFVTRPPLQSQQQIQTTTSLLDCTTTLVNNRRFMAGAGGAVNGMTGSGYISLWSVDGGQQEEYTAPIKTLYTPGSAIERVKWSFQNLVTSSSQENTIRIWDVEKGVCVSTLDAGAAQLSIDTLPYQPLIVCGGVDKRARLWDTRANYFFRTFTESGPIQQVKFRSPNNDPVLMIGTQEGVFKVWNMYISQCVNSMLSHSAPIIGIHSNYDVKEVLSLASNNTMVRYKYEDTSQDQMKHVRRYPSKGEVLGDPTIGAPPLTAAHLISSNNIVYVQADKLYVMAT